MMMSSTHNTMLLQIENLWAKTEADRVLLYSSLTFGTWKVMSISVSCLYVRPTTCAYGTCGGLPGLPLDRYRPLTRCILYYYQSSYAIHPYSSSTMSLCNISSLTLHVCHSPRVEFGHVRNISADK